MSLKVYKTVDELAQYLQENKRFFVKDEDKHFLEDVNYITLVNPFKELFCNGRDDAGHHIYVKDIDFVNLVKAYLIDKQASQYFHGLIGRFEVKFKNTVFSEMCSSYYSSGDVNCVKYVEEIKRFLNSILEDKNMEIELADFPQFCPNINKSLSKQGFVIAEFGLESKLDLLNKIFVNGTGESIDGVECEPKNDLIKHYLKTQSTVPLWVIPNVLTLGEISMLYSMLSFDSQVRVFNKMTGSNNEITCDDSRNFREISRFTGKLEFIRLLRNRINHYEPILPLFANRFCKAKEFKNSICARSLLLLDPGIQIAPFSHELKTCLDLEVCVNYNNLKLIRLTEFFNEIAK